MPFFRRFRDTLVLGPHSSSRFSQSHEPLSFLSGAFTGASSNWSIVEKEAYAIVESLSRLEYLIAGKEVSLFTDHANLIYIFDPVGQNPGIARHTANKLMRWALKLSGYRYVIEHLSGERNVWADILTRWAVKPRDTVRAMNISKLMFAPISPSLSEDFDCPSKTDLISCQGNAKATPPSRFKNTEGIFQDSSGVVWIPSDCDHLLKLRILIAAHTGHGGHRGIQPSLDSLKRHFHWEGMKDDMKAFCKSCLHCLSTGTGSVVPRPLGHGIHADKPNEVLHFDFCYIGKGFDDCTYVLILKDDFSSFVWLFPCIAADAEATADALIEWFSSFGTVVRWVSDRGSHFRNEVVAQLRERVHSVHHFTLAYCPWTNGSVEIVCRELLRAMRALMSEFQLPFKSWPTVVPVVQSVLNNTPLDRLNDACPLTAFTHLPADSPLLAIKRDSREKIDIVSVKEARARQVMNLSRVQDALEGIHRQIAEKASAAREKRVNLRNARTHVRACNFDIGDFVLFGRLQRNVRRKLSLKWHGPRRVTRIISNFLFEIEDLRSGKKSVAHGSRLKFFRNSSYNVSDECLDQLAFQDGELCVVDKFVDIRMHEGAFQVLCEWKGFDEEDPAWEDIDTMRQDVPVLLQEFLEELKKHGTSEQKRLASKIIAN